MRCFPNPAKLWQSLAAKKWQAFWLLLSKRWAYEYIYGVEMTNKMNETLHKEDGGVPDYFPAP